MIKALIENYETLTVVGVFALVMAWYLWHQTRAQTKREEKRDELQAKREEKQDKIQKEEREFYRNLVTNDMKELHKDSSVNAKLNRKSLTMLGTLTNRFTSLTEYLNHHFNGCVDKVNYKKRASKKNGQK